MQHSKLALVESEMGQKHVLPQRNLAVRSTPMSGLARASPAKTHSAVSFSILSSARIASRTILGSPPPSLPLFGFPSWGRVVSGRRARLPRWPPWATRGQVQCVEVRQASIRCHERNLDCT